MIFDSILKKITFSAIMSILIVGLSIIAISIIIQSIEKEIGEKLDTKNPDVLKLLKTIGDCKLK